MPSRRQFLKTLWLVSAGAACWLEPVRLTIGAGGIDLADLSAQARDGNGRGNDNGSGNNGGRNGDGAGNRNGNGNGRGDGNGRSSASGRRSGRDRTADAADDEIDVKHSDGMTEQIRSGRYIMRDARGRLIINRRANASDQQRLNSFR